MKKSLLFAILAVFTIGLQANPAVETIERGYISVNTDAEVSLAPDIAEVSIAVITDDTKSMQNATLKNKEISEKVISSLKSSIDTSKGDYIKTANFNASPIYTYGKDNKKTLSKYQVSNSVIVHTKSIDKVGSMIDKSLALGATNVNSLNFSISNYDDKCTSLIEQASRKAAARANAAAKSVPTTIAGIKSMNVSCSTNNSYRPQYRVAKTMMLGASNDAAEQAAPSTMIEEGIIKLYANVNATYYVK